jgi:hypothetical protein
MSLMEDMVEVDFKPTQVDIVSTKLRTWNLKHAGNVFFTEMVHSRLPDIQDGDPVTIRRVATEIVDILTDERGGRFLKLKEGDLRPTRCFVMGRKQILNKAGHALRTANSKSELRAAIASNPGAAAMVAAKQIVKKKKTPDGAPRAPRPQSESVERTPKLKRPLGKSVTYKVKPGESQPIHGYAVVLIESVCNDKENSLAYRVLDEPGAKYTLDDEPEKERRMRLQLCHRYVSASAAGMTPVQFSRKLLELWGGKLIAIKKEKLPRPSLSPPRQSDIPPPGFPDTGAVTTSPLALQKKGPTAVTNRIWSSVEPIRPGFAPSVASGAPVPNPMRYYEPHFPGSYSPMPYAPAPVQDRMDAAPVRYEPNNLPEFAPMPYAPAPVPNRMDAAPVRYEPNNLPEFAPMPYAPAPVPNRMEAAPVRYEPNNLPEMFALRPLPPAKIGFQNNFLPPPPSARVPTTQNGETSMPMGAQFTGPRHFGSHALPVAAQPRPMWPMTVPPIPVAAPHDQRSNGWPMTVQPVQVPAPRDQQDWPMTVPPVPATAPRDQQHSNTNIH